MEFKPMKRVGILLLSAVALLMIFTLALAQLEVRSAKYLLRVISGEDIRGYFGSDATAAFPFTGGKELFAVCLSVYGRQRVVCGFRNG